MVRFCKPYITARSLQLSCFLTSTIYWCWSHNYIITCSVTVTNSCLCLVDVCLAVRSFFGFGSQPLAINPFLHTTYPYELEAVASTPHKRGFASMWASSAVSTNVSCRGDSSKLPNDVQDNLSCQQDEASCSANVSAKKRRCWGLNHLCSAHVDIFPHMWFCSTRSVSQEKEAWSRQLLTLPVTLCWFYCASFLTNGASNTLTCDMLFIMHLAVSQCMIRL